MLTQASKQGCGMSLWVEFLIPATTALQTHRVLPWINFPFGMAHNNSYFFQINNFYFSRNDLLSLKLNVVQEKKTNTI